MGEWREIPFSDAVQINPTIGLIQGQNYPFVDMASVEVGSRCVFSSEVRQFSGNGSRFKCGDTLMARITPCLENGKIARFCSSNTSAIAHGSTEFIVIRGRENVSDNDFAYYLTKWENVRSYAISQMTGTSGRQRVPVGALAQLIVPLPPLSEQRAIASILGALDDKIDLNRRINETLEAMARAIFKGWFVDFGPTRAKMEGREPYLASEIWGLFPDRLDDDGKPEGWEFSTIGKEVEVVGGSTPSTKDSSFWDGDIHWATPKDLSSLASPVLLDTTRKITNVGLGQISSGLLPVGTVLLSSRAPIGYLAITEVPLAINQGFIGMICEKRLHNVFVWLWSVANMEAIIQNANGSTFQEISKRNFRPLTVVVPSSKVLKCFDDFVRPLYGRIVATEHESHTLAQTRDFLLPKLISGEIQVREAETVLEKAL